MLAVHLTINLLMKGLGQVGVGWVWVGVGGDVLFCSPEGPRTPLWGLKLRLRGMIETSK